MACDVVFFCFFAAVFHTNTVICVCGGICKKDKAMTVYFKYWKPLGALSTTIGSIPLNIFESGKLSQSSVELLNKWAPVVPIGRLDKESTGLLLLTNQAEIAGSLLRTFPKNNSDDNSHSYGSKFEKIYLVGTKCKLSDKQVDRLRNGIEITTLGRRKGATKRTRATLPCTITRSLGQSSTELQFHLREGRNRQIRKMLGALGHAAAYIHRISFGGVTLAGLQGPGDLISLTEDELRLLGLADKNVAPTVLQ